MLDLFKLLTAPSSPPDGLLLLLAALPVPEVLPVVFEPFPLLVVPLLFVFEGFDVFPPSLLPVDGFSVPGVVTFAGELSSSTFILYSLPEASVVTAYTPNSVLLTVTI